ncbi:hypothetical protein QQX98_009149 [Neonectria punicea]|uniref:Clr5 domain-containing protein n=1 Tax=Neonectria punicea TaxID=979145 RepID=A0ABR1GTB0_9HYPO
MLSSSVQPNATTQARTSNAAEASGVQTNSTKKQQSSPSKAAWEKHKEAIHRRYIIENSTLTTTMAAMEDEHQFVASRAMYTEKFVSWRFYKEPKQAQDGDKSKSATWFWEEAR